MKAFLIFPGYFLWHYTLALKDIWHVWTNFLWFVSREFSILTLLGSLFAPWRRVTEGKPAHFNLEKYAEAFVANLMSRLVGAVLRLIIVFIGLCCLLCTMLGGIVFYLVWLLAPLLVVTLLCIGTFFLV